MKSDKTYLQYQRSEAAKRSHWSKREGVQAAIDAGAAELSGPDVDSGRLFQAAEALRRAFLGDRNQHLSYYGERAPISKRALSRLASGDRSLWVLRDAYQSLVNIAEFESIVSDVANHSVGMGFEMPIGRIWSSFEMEYPDNLQLVSRGSGWPKTMFCGTTGQAKSATLETEAIDRYAAGMKVIDFVDTDEYENVLWDTVQQDETLREIREDLDLEPDISRIDDVDRPDVEVLVPYADETSTMDVPVDDDGETVVRPFTIPTSELSETTLVTFLTSLTSPQMETSIRMAYDKVSNQRNWTLKDLSEEILKRDNIGDKFQKRIVRILENLQNKGYFQSPDDPMAIDWERIFNDDRTITAFSVAPLESEVGQLMVLAYIVRSLYEQRKAYDELPPCAAVSREMHEIVPHRNESSADARVEALQEAIAGNFSYILRKNRHERLEILADTQDIMDLKRGVRKRFSRFILFNLPKDSVQNAFDYAGVDNWSSCYKSLGQERGKGAVVGLTEATTRYDRGFVTPVQFAPPPVHHFDVDVHDNGLEARCDLHDEQFESRTWEVGDRPDVSFDAAELLGGDSNHHLVEFADECLEPSGTEVRAEVVLDAYDVWTDREGVDAVSRTWFKRKVEKHVEWVDIENEDRNSTTWYKGIGLSSDGKEYIPTAADASGGEQAPSD